MILTAVLLISLFFPCLSYNRSISEGDINSSSVIALPKRSGFSSWFLNTPPPPGKIPTKHVKPCGKVMTSLENRKAIEEKKKELKKRRQSVKLRGKQRLNREKKLKLGARSRAVHQGILFVLFTHYG